MRTAEWESSAGALATLLNSRQPLEKADVYTLTLPGGAVFRWSGADRALIFGGNTYSLGPLIRRDRVRFVVGIEVSSLNVTLVDNGAVTINGQSLLAFVRGRGLFGAKLQLSRVFWGFGAAQPVGALTWFPGRVADVRLDGDEIRLVVKSATELLDTMVPSEVYQAGCLNDLYSSACGADRAAATFAGSATSASDLQRVTFGHGLGQAPGYFDLGTVRFTSGANAGVVRTVKRHSSSPATLTVLQPWPFAVAAGDAFSIEAGCPRTLTGCAKFHTAENVVLRFRGQPYIPVPETVI